MAPRRGRLRALERRAAPRPAAKLRAAAAGDLHRPSQPDLYLDGSGPAISRGLPIDKALSAETLVAFAINGEALPVLHGGAAAARGPGLSRRVVPEMAGPDRGARPRA